MGNSRKIYGMLLAAPFAVTLAVLSVFALARSIAFSFSDYNLFNEPGWVGIDNFLAILTDHLFIAALWNTVAFAVIVTTPVVACPAGLWSTSTSKFPLGVPSSGES